MSNEIDKQNESVFRPRARLIRALGEELISSETVAIIELVKNAYDADATRLKVVFHGLLEKGHGGINVVDDGHGMDLQTVRSAFLEPSTNSKRNSKNRESPNGRKMLGEKGIGRFASSRLAEDLKLFTRMTGEELEVYGYFDWKQFDDEELYLDEVTVTTERIEPKEVYPDGMIKELWSSDEKPTKHDLSHGTVLVMDRLKQTWNKKNFETLQRGLARLISPLKKSLDFRLFLELPDEFAEYSQEVSAPKIIKYPHYSVKGTVFSNGVFDLNYRIHELEDAGKQVKGRFAFKKDNSELLIIDEKTQIEEVRTPSCGKITIELRIWDRDQLGNVQQALTSSLTDIRRDLNAISGINIYRDNFRVLPYGEPNDDWLRLDIRRVNNPQRRFSNNNIAGYIDITSAANPELKDQTNRQGLDENQALGDLRAIITAVIGEVESRRQELRPKRKGASSRTPIGGIFDPLNLDPIRSHLEKKYPNDKEFDDILTNTQKVFSSQLEQIQTVLARYQSLATLGTLVDVVLHDGRHPVATVTTQSELGLRNIAQRNGDCEELLEATSKRLKKINNQAEMLKTLFRRIEPFGGRKRGRPEPFYLEKIVNDVFDVFESDIKKLGIKLDRPTNETLVRLDQSEIQEVLTNLISNSIYWLQTVPKKSRKIFVEVSRVAPSHVEILIGDSGPGVSARMRDRLFEPYETDKPGGVGLGLSIAGEIVRDYYNGKLELMDNCPIGGAMFRVTLKKRV